MIVVVDHGATTSRWWFYDPAKASEDYFEMKGFSPRYSADESIQDTLRQAQQQIPDKREGEMYFYSTGVSNKVIHSDLKKHLNHFFPEMVINLHTDLTGAGRAMLGDQDGVVAILGTGSNAGFYSNHKVEFQPVNLGYLLGDEGSGAHIGKLLLKDYLEERMPKNLSEEFSNSLPGDKSEVVTFIHKQPSGKTLASFGPFAAKHKEEPYIGQLLEKSFQAFFDHIIARVSVKEYTNLGVSGSIAWLHGDVFKNVAASYGYKVHKILKDPIDEVIEYHKKFLK
ncbi:MAG: hypothetical protein K9J27_00730 [Bacteroidales bacterium]|nr:hypothetical protein [Bacteroidales bacterium]MCF8333125.1 hypothetical protein [Bacteroidales bacterium]